MQHTGYIGGQFVAGEGARFRVENPSDESTVAEIAGQSEAQVAAALAAARGSFDAGVWSGIGNARRADAMRRFAAAMDKRADALRELALREAGCPIGSSVMNAQVTAPLRMTHEAIDYFLSLPEIEENPLPLHERVNAMGMTVQSLKRWTPLGVVSAISAYNVPFYTAMWKVVPALLAGNSVVLRPNPLTPLSAMIFAEAADEAGLPPGVMNVVIEQGLEGARLMTTDDVVDMVSFTGSCTVGALVAQQAAATLKRVVLELGGKSAQIFLPDAVDKAPLQAMVIAVAHAGQGCALGTRIFVPEDAKAQVLDKAAALMAKIKVGPASDPATQTGPVISAAQRARCEHFVAEAVKHGGRVVCGGKRPEGLDKGYYFEPTLLDLPDNANPAAQEEIFGPVAAVIGYRDLDHAVEMANDSRFGLSGYVHGADKAAALQVALRIRSGTVNVNGALMSTYASMGGIRMSGMGRERGLEGFRAFQQLSMLNIGA
ncbi:MAG: aldehyde dehydrogenase family protein [Sphingomonadales bacterium]|nr:aldehyde dehydrogenase family protein [Sphingomonadales bacterium]